MRFFSTLHQLSCSSLFLSVFFSRLYLDLQLQPQFASQDPVHPGDHGEDLGEPAGAQRGHPGRARRVGAPLLGLHADPHGVRMLAGRARKGREEVRTCRAICYTILNAYPKILITVFRTESKYLKLKLSLQYNPRLLIYTK